MLLKNFIALLQRLLVLIILATAVVFCWLNREYLAQVSRISLLSFFMIIGSYVLVFLLNAMMACLLLRQRGHSPSSLDMLIMNCHASILGYATFLRAGYYGSKALFYQKLYGLPVTVSLGLMGLLSLLVVGWNGIFGAVLGLIGLKVQGVSVPLVYWLIVGGTFGLCLAVIVTLRGILHLDFLPPRINVWLRNVHNVILETEWKELGGTGLLSFLAILFQVLALDILFQAFDNPLPVLSYFYISVLSTLSLVLALTPGNVGVRELIIWLLLAGQEAGSAEIIAVMLVDRILQFFAALLVSLGGYHFLKMKLQNSRSSLYGADTDS